MSHVPSPELAVDVRRRNAIDVPSGEKTGSASEPTTYGVPGRAPPVAGPEVSGVSRNR